MASSVEQIPSVLVVRQTFEFVVFVVEAEVDAELSQVDQSVLLGPIMTAVYNTFVANSSLTSYDV